MLFAYLKLNTPVYFGIVAAATVTVVLELLMIGLIFTLVIIVIDNTNVSIIF